MWSTVKTSRAARRRATNGPSEASKRHASHEGRGHGQDSAPAAASDSVVPRLRNVLPDRHRSVSDLWQRNVGTSGSFSHGRPDP